jgi:uncharacterized membrane protein (Fun14 family)
MIDQTLISFGFPLIGGGILGLAASYALKKIMKLAFIGLGLLALLLGYLSYQHWISVNWVTVEHQTSTLMTHAANKITTVTQNMGHEIPIGLGLVGFVPGLALGFVRG